MSNFELSITRTIKAPRSQVFDAWLDPKALARFMTPGPGMTVPKAESEARVGGSFLIVMKAGDTELPHRGTYETIDKYDKLVFTWLSSHAPEGSVVTLTFKELGPAETELTLHHEGLPTQESRDNHQGGWTAIVEQLAKLLS